MKNKLGVLVIVALMSMMFMSCADNTVITQVMTGHQYGFWGGLWHGMIAPFDFIGSLIWDDVTVYAQNNNGCWYAFGFVLGIGGLGGSSRLKK